MNPIYHYRNLPCTAGPFYISGVDDHPEGGGAGVLEWCLDLGDAQRMKEIMKIYPQFRDLSIYRE